MLTKKLFKLSKLSKKMERICHSDEGGIFGNKIICLTRSGGPAKIPPSSE